MLSARAERWRDAWQALDPEKVAALYAADGTHHSDKVARVFPDKSDGMLRGPDEVLAYARLAAARFKKFEILPLVASSSGDVDFIEYIRRIDGDASTDSKVVEVLEWRGSLLTSCRVYHA